MRVVGAAILILFATAMSAYAQSNTTGGGGIVVPPPVIGAEDSLVSIGDADYLSQDFPGGKITYLRYPVLGCPTIIARGNTGRTLVRLPDGGGTTDFNLMITSNGDAAPQSFTLPVQGAVYDPSNGVYTVEYTVPSYVPEDMYDLQLVVSSQSISDKQFNSFKVMAQESSDYTFAIFADPQFNDPRGLFSPGNLNSGDYNATSIVEQMKDEMRSLNPAFVLVLGDLLFGLDYEFEYAAAWDVWKDAGVPVFFIPGNHDLLAAIETRTVLGVTQPEEDGRDIWRGTFGPSYYSFAWGGRHFQGVNSYGGDAARRDSFLIINTNHAINVCNSYSNSPISTDGSNSSIKMISKR